ncbi:MAG: hypothetical protein ABI340_02960 [Nitrososphaera sp.]
MVRHPKKKPEDKRTNTNDPKKDPTKDIPPETPSPMEIDESKIKRGLDKVFWIRIGLGILAGILAAEIGDPLDVSGRVGLGFAIMIIMFIISYGVARSLRIPIPPPDKKKLLTTGYGSYFLMFIFSWILANTLIHAETVIGTVK